SLHIMAGVVAMASVIEDFDTQPCKKSRKDGGSPVVKTITNYFSPVPKPAEKPFSPPRSNNIMDYFSRKAPSSKEKTSSPDQLKDNCEAARHTDKHATPEAAPKQPPQKRSRKASKAARKLVEAETVSPAKEESCVIVEESYDAKDSTAEAVSSCGVLGSDTAALLLQLSAEACITAGKSESGATEPACVEQVEKDGHKDGSKCRNNVECKPQLDSIELSPILPSKNNVKPVKTASRNSQKRQQQEGKPSEPEEKEKESSLCDVSMEVNVDEASQLNSMVTVSFEEFVRSQSQDSGEEDIGAEQSKGDESKITTEADEMDTNQLDAPKAEDDVGPGGAPFQASPRTLTVQAEVHVVSPKQETAKAVGKMASIFNKRKGVTSPAEGASSPHVQAGNQLLLLRLTV
ncbi:hypothetical protein L3Q82_014279, partial [Scortum barcoo]